MTEPHPDVTRAQQAVDELATRDTEQRVAALEGIAAALDSALSDGAD